MVNLKSVKASNAALKSTALVQVSLWVGATSGIAGHTLTEYARYSDKPRIYIIGRNDTKLSEIIRGLEKINAEAVYVPINAEISLMKNVDAACEELKKKEKSLNLLVMCPGYLKLTRVDNVDGLEDTLALRYYVRMRFIKNLIPLLTAPPASRILNIHGAGREGRLVEDDLELKHNFGLKNGAIHTSTMNTLAMGEMAPQHPSISWIHAFPGIVITPAGNKFAEDWPWPLRIFFHWVMEPVAKLFTLGLQESGERHLFHATSARYPPAESRDERSVGVPLPKEINVARGWDQKEGSGFYMLNYDGETVGDEKLMEEYRKKETGKKVWAHTEEVFERVLRKSALS